MTQGWPAVLRAGPVECRPMRRRDGPQWVEVRLRNEDWLRPWEATPPGGSRLGWPERHTMSAYGQLLRRSRAQARAGSHLPFTITLDGRFAGQLNVGEIVRGAFLSGFVGYWVDHAVAGRGVMHTALALVADHCFGAGRLHRLEANIRPENHASLRAAAKVGFVPEGLHRRYLVIDGEFRDHLGHVLLSEDSPGGVLAALRASGGTAW